ncbi:MAG: NAD(P)H-dependent glycerol-3-phosphate dehydrogenase [Bacillota bacterium]
MKKIAVIGAGSFGTALALILEKNGHDVMMYARNEESIKKMRATGQNKKYLPNCMIPKTLELTANKEEVAKFGEIVIFAVPAKAVRQTATEFAPLFSAAQTIVNVAKGVEHGTYKRLSVVLKECIPQCEVCVLSGPSHAEEVANEIPTTCLVASENEEIAKMVQQEFMSPRFRLYTNTDIIGVEIGAALKNVMAIAAGISDGLNFGDNTKAAIMTRGIAEMKRLGLAMGGESETFSGLSGVGDLIVTCTSMHSRNRRAGILIGEGKTLAEAEEEIQMVIEGVYTVKVAEELAKKYKVEMPITNAVYTILFENATASLALLQLMNRDGKSE